MGAPFVEHHLNRMKLNAMQVDRTARPYIHLTIVRFNARTASYIVRPMSMKL